jgi:hypothetical protein
MLERDPFKDLAGARKRGDPWYLIALKAREAINQRGTGLKGEALLIAARAAGYSANLLGRYIAVANFIDELAKEKIAPSRKLRNAPFASMEHLKRAWRIDSSEGRRLLTAVLSGSMSVRTLGTRVGEMERQAGTAAGQRLADLQTRAAQAEAMLKEMMSNHLQFLCDDTRAQWVRVEGRIAGFAWADAVAFGRTANGMPYVDGFELKALPPRASATALFDMIARAALSASFFRRYWILAVAAQPNFESTVSDACERLELNNVGIVVGKPGSQELITLRKPHADALPVPDRREQLIKWAIQRLSTRS